MAKSTAYTLVGPNSGNAGKSASESSEKLHRYGGREWQPGFFRRFPWSGVLSLILAFGCGIAAVVIALVSEGKPLDYWTVRGYVVQPAVLLSIFATIANAFLVFAFTQGATIAWWTSGFKGSSLKNLHNSYHYGTGALSAFTSLTAFNTVALASIFMLFLLMDGPLFQRASSVVQSSQFSRSNSSIPISPSPMLTGATGIVPDHSDELAPSLYAPLFSSVLQQYNNRTPIELLGSGCNGDCRSEIVAPGWDVDCVTSTEPYRLMNENELSAYQASLVPTNNGTSEKSNGSYHGPAYVQTTFSVSAVYNWTLSPIEKFANVGGGNYNIKISTRYKATPGGNGTMGLHTCTLREALIKYPLQLLNNTATLGPMPASVNRTVEYILRQEEWSGQGDYPSTMGGLWLALKTAYATTAKIYPVGGWTAIESSNPTSSMYLRANNASDLLTYEVFWLDPMEDMLSMINELTFRTALTTTSRVPGNPMLGASFSQAVSLQDAQPYIISPNLTTVNRTITQNALISMTTPQTVYATHRGWLAGGFVVICLACLGIIPTYWGWWRLGRPVSMSPLEIARAFDAPILRQADPNATGDDLKKALGKERVRFRTGVDGIMHVDEIGRSSTSVVR